MRPKNGSPVTERSDGPFQVAAMPTSAKSGKNSLRVLRNNPLYGEGWSNTGRMRPPYAKVLPPLPSMIRPSGVLW
ncbi:hypothetical protein D9M73_265000 [compost metagenome]